MGIKPENRSKYRQRLLRISNGSACHSCVYTAKELLRDIVMDYQHGEKLFVTFFKHNDMCPKKGGRVD